MTDDQRGSDFEGRLVAEQRANLIAYLTRVRSLAGPTPDLIHLHGEAGAGSPLEAAVGDSLARAARDGRISDLEVVFDAVPDELLEDAISELARWSESFPLEVERENAAAVLLAATEMLDPLPGGIADHVSTSIIARPGALRREILTAAVRVARAARGPQRLRFGTALAAAAELFTDRSTRHELIAAVGEIEALNRAAGEAWVRSVENRDREAMKLLEGHQPSQLDLLLGAASGSIDERRTPTEAEADDPAVETDEAETTDDLTSGLAWALGELAELRIAATRIAVWLLEDPSKEGYEAIGLRMDSLEPVEDQELTTLMISRAVGRSPEEQGRWLQAIDPASLSQTHAAGIDELAAALWVSGREGGDDTEALDALQKLHEELEPAETSAAETAIDEGIRVWTSDEEAGEARDAAAAARGFVQRGLADECRCADVIMRVCASVVQGWPPPPNMPSAEVGNTLVALVDDWCSSASYEQITALVDVAAPGPPAECLGALLACWLRLEKELATRDPDREVDAPVASLAALAGTPDELTARAIDAAAEWWPGELDIWRLVEDAWNTELRPDIRRALARAAKALRPPAHQRLVDSAVEAALAASAPPENWEAVAIRDVKAGWLVDRLASHTKGEEGNTELWRRVLGICRERAPGSASRPAIATKLLLPLARQGTDEAVDLVLEHLELVGRKQSQVIFQDLELTEAQAERLDARFRALDWKRGPLEQVIDGLLGRG